jgi:hypothetical protein
MIRANLTYEIHDPNIIRVGNGSGALNITQASLGAVDGNIVLIQAGTYSSITISDFTLLSNQRIYIKNEGQVYITEVMDLYNLAGVTIAGDYTADIDYGFKFVNINFRAIRFYTRFTRSVIKNMYFENVKDYCIATDSSLDNQQYDGTDLTRNEEVKFLNLEFNNANGIHWMGVLDKGQNADTNYTKGFEVAHCYFHDTKDAGSVIWGGNVEEYNVHHNKFERLNAENNNHNGLTTIMGRGEYHHNYLNYYQGNAIRAWVYSRGSIAKETRIYNNICANTRKYSGFEFQSFDRFVWPGKTTTGICECFHNTVFNMHYENNVNTVSGNYHGVILDIFGMAGSISSAWNNVGIRFIYPDPHSVLWGNSDPDQTYPGTNRYYATLTEAGLTEDDLFNVIFGSPLLSGDSRVNPIATDDFYGNPRVGFATIGAIQDPISVPRLTGQLPFDSNFFYQDNLPVNNTDVTLFTKTDFEPVQSYGQLYPNYKDVYMVPKGMNFKLKELKLGDGAGTSETNPFIISAIRNDGTEVPVYSFTGQDYNIEISYILPVPLEVRGLTFFIQGNAGRPTYVKMIGEYTPIVLRVIPATVRHPFGNQIGVNGFTWSWSQGPQQNNLYYEQGYQLLKKLGSCRLYLDTDELVKVKGKYRYKSNWRGYDTDTLFSRFKADGIFANICLQGLPEYIVNTWPVNERDTNLTRPYQTPKEAVESYRALAEIAFQFAARYGRNTNIDLALIEVDTTQPPYETPSGKIVGLGYIELMEMGNELDKWWKGEDCNFLGRQFAYYQSAVYDGHKGTMGNNTGIKTADPTMKVTNAGLASFHPDFIWSFVRECEKIRGYLPGGEIDIPLDGYYSFHSYPNTEDSQYTGLESRGMCIEQSDVPDQLSRFLEVNYRHCGDLKIVSGEVGYDLSVNSPLRAEPPAGSNISALIWQGILNLRVSLFYAKHGVYRNFFFNWMDDGAIDGGQFSSCGITDLTGTAPNISLVLRPSAKYSLQVNGLLKDYVWQKEVSSSPLIDEWRNGNDVIYSLYYPTEINQTGIYSYRRWGITQVQKYSLNETGESLTLEIIDAVDSTITLPVSEKPLFFRII